MSAGAESRSLHRHNDMPKEDDEVFRTPRGFEDFFVLRGFYGFDQGPVGCL
jgi:hypothetical protein